MNKITTIGITIVGILMVLAMFGVDGFGTVTSGAMGWIIAIIVLIVGVEGLYRKFKA